MKPLKAVMKDKREALFLILILIGAVLFRLPLLIEFHYALNFDEAVYGLMAQDILAGKGIPLFFYGQNYFGPLEAVFTLPFFLLFSPTTLPLRLSILTLTLLGLIFFWQGYRLLVRESDGLVFLSWLALSPLVLTIRSIHPSGHMGGLFCGGVVFFLTAKVITSPWKPTITFFLLGAVSGFGLWMHPGTLIYILPAAIIILWNDFRSLRFLPFALLGGVIGGFPFWEKTLSLHFNTFNFGQSGLDRFSLLPFSEDLRQSLANMHSFLANDLLPTSLSLLVWAFFLILVLAGFSLLFIKNPGLSSTGKKVLLFSWLLILLTFFAYSYVQASRFQYISYRYYLPLLIGLGFIFDLVLNQVGFRSPALRRLLMTMLIAVNLAANFLGFQSESYFRYQFNLNGPYVRWVSLPPVLQKSPIDRAYVDFLDEGPLNFVFNGKKIFSSFSDSRYQDRLWEVDASPAPAFIFPDPQEAELFKKGLEAIGRTHHSLLPTADHTLFYNIRPPEGIFRPIDREEILVSTYPNSKWSHQLLDGNTNTIWSTAGPQKGNECILLDLKKPVRLARVDLIPRWLESFPVHLIIETSLDGLSWSRAADLKTSNTLFWAGPHPVYKVWEGFFQYIFPERMARYVRIKQTGSSTLSWDLGEISLYTKEPDKKNFLEPDWKSLTLFLKKEGVTFLISDPYASPNIRRQSRGEIKTTVRFNPAYPDLNIKEGIPAGEMQALTIHYRDQEQIRSFLQQQGWDFLTKDFGEYFLFYRLKNPLSTLKTLPVPGLIVTPSHNPGEARFLFDSAKNTRWSSQTPRKEGMSLIADFRKTTRVSGLILDPGPHQQDAVEKINLFYSSDGLSYQKIDSSFRFHQSLRWTGSHLIGKSTETIYLFPAIETRFLKMVCGENNPVFYWSVAEMTLLGPGEGR
ncbi:MAG: discoidin domain-containing protein [Thermodesulfobacteriota bacterium]